MYFCENTKLFTMAYFIGTEKDFKRYIGPILRNLVQQITRDYRRQIGKCQFCGTTYNLEAAHVHGKDRNTIISNLLKSYKTGSEYNVSLSEFEKQFRSHHAQVEEAILILCKQCHYEYDKGHGNTIQQEEKSIQSEIISSKSESVSSSPSSSQPARLYSNSEIQSEICEVLKTLSKTELEYFCDLQNSKEVFGLRFPLLMKIPANIMPAQIQQYLKDDKGKNRWTLKYSVKVDGYIYAITTQWYVQNDIHVNKFLRKYKPAENE